MWIPHGNDAVNDQVDNELDQLSTEFSNFFGKAREFGSKLFDVANEHVLQGAIAGLLAPESELDPCPDHRYLIGVLGSSTHEHLELAIPLGRWIASHGCHLITGGGRGTAMSTAKAFTSIPNRAGFSIGVLPCQDEGIKPREGYPNPWVEIPLATNLPLAPCTDSRSRNHIIALSSDILIALPGTSNTAHEVELALRYGRPVAVFLGNGDSTIEGLDLDLVPVLRDLNQLAEFIQQALNDPITKQPFNGLDSESMTESGDDGVGHSIDTLSPKVKKDLERELILATQDLDASDENIIVKPPAKDKEMDYDFVSDFS